MAQARYVAVLPRLLCKPDHYVVTETYLSFTETFDVAHPPVELSSYTSLRLPGLRGDFSLPRARLKAVLRTRHLRKQEVGLIAYLEVHDHVRAYVGGPADLPGYNPMRQLALGNTCPVELLVEIYYDLLMLLPVGQGRLTLEHVYLWKHKQPVPILALVWHRT